MVVPPKTPQNDLFSRKPGGANYDPKHLIYIYKYNGS